MNKLVMPLYFYLKLSLNTKIALSCVYIFEEEKWPGICKVYELFVSIKHQIELRSAHSNLGTGKVWDHSKKMVELRYRNSLGSFWKRKNGWAQGLDKSRTTNWPKMSST